jgi:hypothetical protein
MANGKILRKFHGENLPYISKNLSINSQYAVGQYTVSYSLSSQSVDKDIEKS